MLNNDYYIIEGNWRISGYNEQKEGTGSGSFFLFYGKCVNK